VPKAVARPTTDRTREALFSLLNAVVPGARCLDLFAGSGALGLEALSRGATSCVFIDQDRGSVRTVQGNLKDLGLEGGQVRSGDATELKGIQAGSVEIVFADPPYAKKAGDRDFVQELISSSDLFRIVADDGFFVAEAPAGRVATAPVGWEVISERKYGNCGIAIYQKKVD